LEADNRAMEAYNGAKEDTLELWRLTRDMKRLE
jgi:hypothetical protein